MVSIHGCTLTTYYPSNFFHGIHHALHWVCLGVYFSMPHVKKALWSLSFSVLLVLVSSRFIHIVAKGVNSLFLILECSNGMFGCRCFHNLSTMDRDSGTVGADIPEDIHSFTSVVHPWQLLLACMVGTFTYLFFHKPLCCFLKHLHHFYSSVIRHRVPPFSILVTAFAIVTHPMVVF